VQSIVVLGSTGSIGVNTLKIAKKFGIKVEGIVANSNTTLLNQQIEKFQPKYVAIANEKKKDAVKFDSLFVGSGGIIELLHHCQSPLVVNAMVGYSGVMPSIECLKLGKRLALANKESLVVAGKFLDCTQIHPIDSEHFGLWYLMGEKKFSKLYITASGGALRDWDVAKMKDARVEDVLRHPNWSMGQKITVDSATMVNKLFEVLEAKWLFNTDKIDALIEEKSIIHALIEFEDGSTTAHIADVDMKLPIAYALNQKIEGQILKPIDLLKVGSLKFKSIEEQKYPLWKMKDYLLQNPDMGLVLNAANDMMVEKFLNKEVSFEAIYKNIDKAIEKFDGFILNSLSDIELCNSAVRNFLLT